jgi:uncharacterized protein YndB with AHSA1/START domain
MATLERRPAVMHQYFMEKWIPTRQREDLLRAEQSGAAAAARHGRGEVMAAPSCSEGSRRDTVEQDGSDVAAIRHRVGIDACVLKVYDALATREGVAGWWTRDVRGASRPGKALAFYFGDRDPSAVMEVRELSRPECVVWRCTEGPSEWMNTTVSFFLYEDGPETVLLFTHAGWSEPFEFMHHCSTKWAYFLLGLKAGFEGGKANPWPDDMAISRLG